MRVVAIIQARIGSTRFPGKVLAKLNGKPLIEWVATRVGNASSIDKVVWAIPDGEQDDILAEALLALKQSIVRGSESDVLSRFNSVVKQYSAEIYVRLTSDNPMLPSEVIDAAVKQFMEAGVDYLATTYPVSRIPDGFDVEVFSKKSILRAYNSSYWPSDREHVTKYIWSNPNEFVLGEYSSCNQSDLSNMRFAIDSPNDLAVAELLSFNMEEGSFEEEVERYKSIEDEITTIRGITKNNEGLDKSLSNDLSQLLVNNGNFTKSNELLERSKNVIPGGAQTFSKGYTQFAAGATPLFLNRARDCFVWDVDGNVYVDYIMGIGPVLLGHSDYRVDKQVKKQIDRLICPSISSELEVDVAERIVELSNWAGAKVRFAKNGSDVTTGAVRVARAYTDREKIVCGGYHGWHDWYIGTTTRNVGVPESTCNLSSAVNVFDFNLLEEQLKTEDVAAVILEPMSSFVPEQKDIEALFSLCRKYGTLVIFDECWTGFRVHEFGASSYYGVQPDLACFGKGCGNGYPVSFLIGKPEIMQMFSEVFFSFTFAGDAAGLAAIDSVLDVLEVIPVHDQLKTRGRNLWRGIEQLIEEHGLSDEFSVIGYDQKPLLNIKNDDTKSLYRTLVNEYFASNGILFGGYHVLSMAHSHEVIKYTLDVYDSFFASIASIGSVEELEKMIKGRQVEDVFRRH